MININTIQKKFLNKIETEAHYIDNRYVNNLIQHSKEWERNPFSHNVAESARSMCYQYTTYSDIALALRNSVNHFSTNKLSHLLQMPNLIENIYHKWKKADVTNEQAIEDVINELEQEQAEKMKKQQTQNKNRDRIL